MGREWFVVMASSVVVINQSWFIKGRRIHDAVFAIESSAVAASIDDPEDVVKQSSKWTSISGIPH